MNTSQTNAEVDVLPRLGGEQDTSGILGTRLVQRERRDDRRVVPVPAPARPLSPTRVALYRRVSTAQQADRDLSLPEQQAQQREYVARTGGLITHEYEDSGISGTSADARPAFLEMVAAAKRGEFDVILVHKSDRVFRNKDEASTYRILTRKIGVRWASVTEAFFGSPEPTDKLLTGIMESVNEFYVDNLRAEVRKGIRSAAVHKGHQHGQPPYGYRWADLTVKGSGWAVDDADAERLRYIYDRMDVEGPTIAALARHMNALGWPSPGSGARGLRERGLPRHHGSDTGGWHAATLTKMLTNRCYLGEIQHDGQWLPGAHPPVVGAALFDRVQSILDRRAPGRAESSPALFGGGLLLCPYCLDNGRESPLHVHCVSPVVRADGSVRAGGLAYRCSRRADAKYRLRLGLGGADADTGGDGAALVCPGFQVGEAAVLRLVLTGCAIGQEIGGADGPAPPVLPPRTPVRGADAALLRELAELPNVRANYDVLFGRGRITLDRYDELIASLDGRETAIRAALERPQSAPPPIPANHYAWAAQALEDPGMATTRKRDRLRELFRGIAPTADKHGIIFLAHQHG